MGCGPVQVSSVVLHVSCLFLYNQSVTLKDSWEIGLIYLAVCLDHFHLNWPIVRLEFFVSPLYQYDLGCLFNDIRNNTEFMRLKGS